MKSHPTSLIILSLTLLLTACVPIPAAPPETSPALPTPTPAPPAAEPKAGLSDLASGLAKIDQSDDIQQYSQLLDEFAACMNADINTEEDAPNYSDSETIAVSIFFAGMLTISGIFVQQFEQAFSENNAADDQTEHEPSFYEMLEVGLTACLEDESE